jgi:hypothetical protein
MAKRDVTAAAAFGAAVRPDVRPMTAGMAAACRGRATSERAVLDARSSRSEATVADLASATGLRLLGRGHCAREAGRCRQGPSQYRLARGCAGASDRSSLAAEQGDAEPATGCGAAVGRPAPTAMTSTTCRELPLTAPRRPALVLSRGPSQAQNPTARRHRHRGAGFNDAAEESSGGAPHASSVPAFAITRTEHSSCVAELEQRLPRLWWRTSGLGT